MQLPTTTVHVLAPEQAVDSHGHAAAYAWTQRGPYPAHLAKPRFAEQHGDRDRLTVGWTVVLAPEAWPVRQQDRLLLEDGRVLQVTGSRLVPNVAGSPVDLAHVSADCLELAEATT